MDDPQTTPARQFVQVRRRRGVRFVPWLLVGAVLGAIAGVAVSLLGDSEPRYTDNTQTGYMAMMGLLLGLLVFGLVAAVVDVVLLRRR